MPINTHKKRAWVVAVNMGYGHERAASPFSDIAEGGIIIANNYPGIPAADRRKWESSRWFYELVSRAGQLPLVGAAIFNFYDREFQQIEPFYPKRDLSAPSFQLRQMFRLIRKGWGKNLIDFVNRDPSLPFLTSFFLPAFMAEAHGYRGEIYCILCDADISRTWAPLHPGKTRINYLAPNSRVVERLKLYGVPAKNIHLTGFPLPDGNIGGTDLGVLKKDLWHRIHHLDPSHNFINKYQDSLVHYLGAEVDGHCSKQCRLTLTFAVGGAGSQRELGGQIIKNLKSQILKDQLRVNLVAGVRHDVYDYFRREIKKIGLEGRFGKNLKIIFDLNKPGYFDKFNAVLRTTDVLWTKPSELVFYAGLGLPIVMAPPIGSQEQFNRHYLEAIGAGLDQGDSAYIAEWLFDWHRSGWLAEAAFQGFLDAPKFGAYKIKQLIFHRHQQVEGHVELL
ncbi:MAG: hypothetical protein WCT37_05365 [Patescibacteria group bacterium]|jgi:hypothetical protein